MFHPGGFSEFGYYLLVHVLDGTTWTDEYKSEWNDELSDLDRICQWLNETSMRIGIEEQ